MFDSHAVFLNKQKQHLNLCHGFEFFISQKIYRCGLGWQNRGWVKIYTENGIKNYEYRDKTLSINTLVHYNITLLKNKIPKLFPNISLSWAFIFDLIFSTFKEIILSRWCVIRRHVVLFRGCYPETACSSSVKL